MCQNFRKCAHIFVIIKLYNNAYKYIVLQCVICMSQLTRYQQYNMLSFKKKAKLWICNTLSKNERDRIDGMIY